MRVRSGVRLGPYEIVAPLGAGGMGEVFTARDTRLERIVAIKILPHDLAGDEARRSRLQREAKVIARLNHPHICTLHDTGSQDGIDFLVMEHLQGCSLAERLTKGALPLDEVIHIGIEIAEALHSAHRQQITHRDLKPGNIMLTAAGVKLLDFGLARFTDESDSTLTADGAVVGTPRYMAPEQIEGRASDHRADVFALGCVLYEMRTGNAAVGGVARVDPPDLDHLIAKCLERDPERRQQSAWDVAEELRWIGKAAHQHRRRRLLTIALTAIAIAGLAASFATWRARQQHKTPLRATFTRVTNAAGLEGAPAISPDGKLIIYESSAVGNADIYLQRIGGWRAVNLTADSKSDDTMPAFSRDGQHIAFRSERDGGGIFVMGATGESVRRVSDFGFNPAWSPDGKELAVSSTALADGPYAGRPAAGELWRIDVATGQRKRVFHGDALTPGWSPRGRRLVFSRGRRGDILSIPAEGGGAVSVTEDLAKDWNPVWSGDGFIYFSSDRGGSMNLWRVPIDETTGVPRGDPEPVTTPALWSGPLSVSGDGKRVAYCARNPQSVLERLSFDPAREIVVGDPVEVPLGNLFVAMPEVSPDGQWIAFSTLFQQEDVHLIRSDGTELRKLTDDGFTDTWPRWSPDGKQIAFTSNRMDVNRAPETPFQVWVIRFDGSGLRQVTAFDGGTTGPPVWRPDGRAMITPAGTKTCASGKCLTDLSGPLPVRKASNFAERLFDDGFRGPAQEWSPDGKWLVGTAWPLGKPTDDRVFVYSVERGDYQFLPPPLRGTARWMSDSRRILVLSERQLYVVDARTLSPRKVHSFALPAAGIALSKDDRTIYFMSASDEADIWVADLQ